MTADEKKLRIREYNRQYAKDHPEKQREHHRKYREKNLEKVRASDKRWRENNPEKSKENARRWRKNNPERAILSGRSWGREHPEELKMACKEATHRYRLKVRGLTIIDYNEMLSNQRGVCAICGRTNKSGQRLSVDHNHRTGKNRGLLCGRCNTAIGLFDENTGYLTAAISYLMEWENGYDKTESNLDAAASI